MLNEQKALEIAKWSAKEAGRILKEFFSSMYLRFEEKGISDWVSEADRMSERTIAEMLSREFPADIVGEEFGEKRRGSELTWYIDPLDGTKNFVRRIPFFCISIALAYRSEIILGVVYSPLDERMFWAIKGGGAYLNDRRINVSREKEISRCIIATGLPFRSREHIDKHLSFYREFFLRGVGIRHMGSAALEMCYVASGSIDGFWEIGLSPWDIAAGSLIVREAEGVVSDIWGGNAYLETGCVICSNRQIHEEMVRISKEIFTRF